MEEVKVETIEGKNEKPSQIEPNSDFIAIEEAERKIRQMEDLNRRLEENLKRSDRMMAENMLRGRSFAGQKELTEDEKAVESARKLLEGTGLDPFK